MERLRMLRQTIGLIPYIAMTGISHPWLWLVPLLLTMLTATVEVPRALNYQPTLQNETVAHAEREESKLRRTQALVARQIKAERRDALMHTQCLVTLAPTWNPNAGRFVLEERVNDETVYASDSNGRHIANAMEAAVRSKGG